MRVTIIGGSGHIGSYLVPRLVEAGFEAVCVSRGQRKPYVTSPAWPKVERVSLDRDVPGFDAAVAQLGSDAVIDLTCYTIAAERSLVEALRDRNTRLLHCGTIWVHGMSVEVPTTEDQPRRPISDYGVRKAQIESFLLQQTDVPAAIVHPGHLVGEGMGAAESGRQFQSTRVSGSCIRPRDRAAQHRPRNAAPCPCRRRRTVFRSRARVLAGGRRPELPRRLAWGAYPGRVRRKRCRMVRADSANTLPALEEWRKTVTEKEASVTWDHIARSPHCSIARAKTRLGYEPRCTSLEAIREALFSPLYPRPVTS